MTDKDENKLHHEVRDKIKKLIIHNKFQVGDDLPTYQEFSKQCRVSLVTIQKAMTLLKEEGIIKGRPGQGTSLAALPTDHPLGITDVALIFATTLYSIFRIEYLHHICQGLYNEADQQDFTCRLLSTKSGPPPTPRSLEASGVDAAVLVGIVNKKYLQLFAKANYPSIIVDNAESGVDLDAILPDNRSAVEDVINYLIDLGHEKIVYLGGYVADSVAGPGLKEDDPVVEDSAVVERRQSYIDIMDEKGLENMALFPPKDSDLRDRIVPTIKNLSHHPTAILCYDNEVAGRLIRELEKEDISCPEDISVAAVMGPLPQGSKLPDITQCLLPFAKMGKMALRHIHSITPMDMQREPDITRLKAELHKGNTVGPVNNS